MILCSYKLVAIEHVENKLEKSISLIINGYYIMHKNIVLIDFESVQPESIAELSSDYFNVLIFIGANQTKISFELAVAIQKMGSRAEYIKISGNGPNAMDFHIAFYIGQLSIQNPTAYFHIISKDKGFDPLIQHLNTKQIHSMRVESISEIPIVKNSLSNTLQEQVPSKVQTLEFPQSQSIISENELNKIPILQTSQNEMIKKCTQLIITKLSSPIITKPQTAPKLFNVIKSHCKLISEIEIQFIIDKMQELHFISIHESKIIYNNSF